MVRTCVFKIQVLNNHESWMCSGGLGQCAKRGRRVSDTSRLAGSGQKQGKGMGKQRARAQASPGHRCQRALKVHSSAGAPASRRGAFKRCTLAKDLFSSSMLAGAHRHTQIRNGTDPPGKPKNNHAHVERFYVEATEERFQTLTKCRGG